MPKISLRRSSRSGSIIPIALAGLLLSLALAAVAVDLGMIFVAKSEAQRAAEVGALTGAMSLVEEPGNTARAFSLTSAVAASNTVRQQPVELKAEDVVFNADPERAVEVWVRRYTSRGNPISTWFGAALGKPEADVGAWAAAGIFPTGSANCLKPFIVPDLWDDTNRNGKYDAGEYYKEEETGYGTTRRQDGYVKDHGRPVALYIGTPEQAIVSSWYFLYRRPGESGGDDIRSAIADTECHPSILSRGDTMMVDREPGLKKGPVRQGLSDLIAKDPGAYWDQASLSVRGSVHGEAWRASPRVATIPLFNPTEPLSPGNRPIRIVGFASVFIEDVKSDRLIGRFLPAIGVAQETDCRDIELCASFAKVVRLTQ